MESRGLGLLLMLVLLTGAAGAVLAAEAQGLGRLEEDAEAFQRLVGGLGFGPGVDLSECTFGFDPRLDGACAMDDGPVPGGACFCPRHAASVLYYPPLGNAVPAAGARDGHAPHR